jgi:hypothetical protein
MRIGGARTLLWHSLRRVCVTASVLGALPEDLGVQMGPVCLIPNIKTRLRCTHGLTCRRWQYIVT